MRRSILLGALLVSACIPQPRVAPPAAPPAPVTRPSPTPAPPPPLATDWRDWPLTPGDWRYAGGISTYVAAGTGTPLVTLGCDRAMRRMTLTLAGAVPASVLTVRTTSLVRTLPLTGNAATLPASDALLDALAFSRGRFTLEQAGQPPLVLPPYAEVGRAIQDCRG